ncbi:hypothetical protein A3E39_02995 [Candidatus Uhrbacteria bacterium RIFCSPHIGHO2_12_FULL_60_25]|uniref:NlpC/P60 domain-containing protein n=1 Tax=Candidatus Uhrbacteria bacterium RIFCSPHIGHO2_12_FULL_60_25 TaxID=1802399 RepID=A0A1F7UKG5_9BACT|nr:MAG: hypothetical protein A3D73_00345 [Candidatus Uhrbacteria bacterium RIFCSPHIGHO2_02_FULL_60_44]OGL78197.1 MAG: hypothetical protein A3E39_02995 [Candidatus Uhrbacteria bacterium RIFCSPHIGHO2_12_FULL_60_25]
MHFRASGRRIAVDVDSWHLPLPTGEILNRLRQSGFVLRDIDVSRLSLSCVERSVYRRGARFVEAPRAFDCSSFAKWLYAERGIWIPRRCLHQFSAGIPVEDDEIMPGDLAFLSGSICPPVGTPDAHVSHVGVVTDRGLVVHATPDAQLGVSCDDLTHWKRKESWCGARRFVPFGRDVLTFDIPSHLEIETSDDVCWHLLETIDWSN